METGQQGKERERGQKKTQTQAAWWIQHVVTASWARSASAPSAFQHMGHLRPEMQQRVQAPAGPALCFSDGRGSGRQRSAMEKEDRREMAMAVFSTSKPQSKSIVSQTSARNHCGDEVPPR